MVARTINFISVESEKNVDKYDSFLEKKKF